MSSVSGLLFAKDARKVARFYMAVLEAELRREDADHCALDVQGFPLIVHQIPAHHANDVEIGNPPSRRESGAIRLDYAVRDVVKARNAAKQLGGQIDDQPPAWAAGDSRFFLGFDPEGNVFGVSAEQA